MHRSKFSTSPQLHRSGGSSTAIKADQSSLKPMIMRMEMALGCEDLARSMVLVSKPPQTTSANTENRAISFVVGYNGSVHSQMVLDLAFWMAHQTRLAKPNPVLVHIVYVIETTRPDTIDAADRILWQARSLASEWQGPLNSHLRVGNVASALSQVAREEQADVLLLGCHNANHALVQQLAKQTPCSILGLLTQ